jgi:hypothetical protein
MIGSPPTELREWFRHNFLGCITEAFADLAAVADDTLTPQQLRQTSLLGSVGTLRVLAGVYHELSAAEVDDEEITDFFRRLDRHMIAPVCDHRVVPQAPGRPVTVW